MVTLSKVLWTGTQVPSCQRTNCQAFGTPLTRMEGNTATTTHLRTRNKVCHRWARDGSDPGSRVIEENFMRRFQALLCYKSLFVCLFVSFISSKRLWVWNRDRIYASGLWCSWCLYCLRHKYAFSITAALPSSTYQQSFMLQQHWEHRCVLPLVNERFCDHSVSCLYYQPPAEADISLILKKVYCRELMVSIELEEKEMLWEWRAGAAVRWTCGLTAKSDVLALISFCSGVLDNKTRAVSATSRVLPGATVQLLKTKPVSIRRCDSLSWETRTSRSTWEICESVRDQSLSLQSPVVPELQRPLHREFPDYLSRPL